MSLMVKNPAALLIERLGTPPTWQWMSSVSRATEQFGQVTFWRDLETSGQRGASTNVGDQMASDTQAFNADWRWSLSLIETCIVSESRRQGNSRRRWSQY